MTLSLIESWTQAIRVAIVVVVQVAVVVDIPDVVCVVSRTEPKTSIQTTSNRDLPSITLY